MKEELNAISSGPGMSIIVKTVTRWVKSFIFLFGLYIVIFGHLTPGGGFSGGVILSCAFILILLAFGRDRALRKFSIANAETLDSMGALGFMLIAALGLFVAGIFFVNWMVVPTSGWLNTLMDQNHLNAGPFRLLSAGTIPINNIFIALKVCASLYLVFVVLSMLHIDNGSQEV
jgi:multisubunit Na+/H+ antiporter MnhB subunit